MASFFTDTAKPPSPASSGPLKRAHNTAGACEDPIVIDADTEEDAECLPDEDHGACHLPIGSIANLWPSLATIRQGLSEAKRLARSAAQGTPYVDPAATTPPPQPLRLATPERRRLKEKRGSISPPAYTPEQTPSTELRTGPVAERAVPRTGARVRPKPTERPTPCDKADVQGGHSTRAMPVSLRTHLLSPSPPTKTPSHDVVDDVPPFVATDAQSAASHPLLSRLSPLSDGTPIIDLPSTQDIAFFASTLDSPVVLSDDEDVEKYAEFLSEPIVFSDSEDDSGTRTWLEEEDNPVTKPEGKVGRGTKSEDEELDELAAKLEAEEYLLGKKAWAMEEEQYMDDLIAHIEADDHAPKTDRREDEESYVDEIVAQLEENRHSVEMGDWIIDEGDDMDELLAKLEADEAVDKKVGKEDDELVGIVAQLEATESASPAHEPDAGRPPTGPSQEPLLDSADFSSKEPRLSNEQQDLVDLIVSGKNVFYTGPAGSGKSTVLRAFTNQLRKSGKDVHILAPTGRAALQVSGTTTWTFAGWTPDAHARPIGELRAGAHGDFVWRRLNHVDVLVIDEISMIENLHFERLNLIMQEARTSDKAFGGVQVVVTGDFCQLPPPKPFKHCLECGRETTMRLDTNRAIHSIGSGKPGNRDRGKTYLCPRKHRVYRDEEKWAFMSEAWKQCGFASVHLQSVHRQRDPEFLRLLQKCRLGLPLSPAEIGQLTHENEPPMNMPADEKTTRLFPTRSEATTLNQQEYNRLPGPTYMYWSRDTFLWRNRKDNRHLQRKQNRRPPYVPPSVYTSRSVPAAVGSPFPKGEPQKSKSGVLVASPIRGALKALEEHRYEDVLELREGMLVMLLANIDLDAGLCNGSQGIICGFTDGADLDMDRSNPAPVKQPTSQISQLRSPARKGSRSQNATKAPWMEDMETGVDVLPLSSQPEEEQQDMVPPSLDQPDHTVSPPGVLSRADFRVQEVNQFLTEDRPPTPPYDRPDSFGWLKKEESRPPGISSPSSGPSGSPSTAPQPQRRFGWPIVRFFHDNLSRIIRPSCSLSELGDRAPYSFLSRTQIPLCAAWAVTIHKSQGLTLDRVTVNLGRAFADGHVYVALSRATSLAGLRLEGNTDCLRQGSSGDAEVRRFLMDTFGSAAFPRRSAGGASQSGALQARPRW